MLNAFQKRLESISGTEKECDKSSRPTGNSAVPYRVQYGTTTEHVEDNSTTVVRAVHPTEGCIKQSDGCTDCLKCKTGHQTSKPNPLDRNPVAVHPTKGYRQPSVKNKQDVETTTPNPLGRDPLRIDINPVQDTSDGKQLSNGPLHIAQHEQTTETLVDDGVLPDVMAPPQPKLSIPRSSPGDRGAASVSSSMKLSELSALLGAKDHFQTSEISGYSTSHNLQERPTSLNDSLASDAIDRFPKPPNKVIEFSREEFCSRWFFQTETGDFEVIPKVSTKWMMTWVCEYKVIPPTFAPVLLKGETTSLSPSGRARTSKLLLKIRELCEGEFRVKGDFFRGFKCTWSSSTLHSCNSILYVIACSSDVADTSKSSINVQCVFTEGCSHHRDDTSRGIVRSFLVDLKDGNTPHGQCHDHVKRADPLTLMSGNRTFGYLKTSAARQAQSRKRKEEFNFGRGVIQGLAMAAEDLASEDLTRDVHKKLKFYGALHDLSVGNAGDLRSISIYHDLSLRIMAAEFKGNASATAIIDCTGKLVRDIWVSCASDLAKRSREGKSKKPKEVSAIGKHVKYDVLNFHFVIPLGTGPFVGCEAVVVDRTAPTFIGILDRLKRRLSEFGQNADAPRFVVSDMSVPFEIAVLHVFNRMFIPEYVSCLLFAAKISDKRIVDRQIRTKLVWCGVHGDRALRKFANDKLKSREKSLVDQFSITLRNIRLAFTSCKTYEDLCKLVGFVDVFLSAQKLPALSCARESRTDHKCSEEDLYHTGEKIVWEYLGGVPKEQEGIFVSKVMVDACKEKGYNPERLERAFDDEPEEDSSTEEDAIQSTIEEPESENSTDFIASSTGILKQTYGPFDVYIAFREAGKIPNRARYRVYIPSLSILEGSLSGFTVWKEKFDGEEYVWNEFFLDGKTRQYFRKQWFPNLALICPVFFGDVPLTHNTAVELSFKNKKHHTELGLLARQRPGGMDVVEYSKRAGVHMRLEATRVVALLREVVRSKRDPRKRAAVQREKSKALGIKKFRTSFDQLSKKSNPILANDLIVAGVFKPKETEPSESQEEGKPIPCDPVRVGVPLTESVVEAPSAEMAPSTQQSQHVLNLSEEQWERKGRGREEESDRAFVRIMRESKERYFRGWTLRKIAEFLTKAFLESRKMKIDSSALSRIFNHGQLPSAPKCSVLMETCRDELPRRTVVDETLEVDLELLPGVEIALNERLHSAEQVTDGDKMVVRFGDGEFRSSDLKKMIRPEGWTPPESKYWISDECVNILTSLFSTLKSTSTCYYFNSLCVQRVLQLIEKETNLEEAKGSDVSAQLNRIISRQKETRLGQSLPFSEATRGFAPCFISNCHWIGFRMERESFTIQGIDSGSNMVGDKLITNNGTMFADFISRLDGNTWTFSGIDCTFPKQVNSMDCGILMLIAARNWKLRLPMLNRYREERNTSIWRKRFAHEILSARVT